MTNHTASQLLSRSYGLVVIENLFAIILTVSAIAGNVLVFAAVCRTPQLRKVSNVYIVCLSLTNFFMGVFVFPIVDASLIIGKFPGGMNLCWFQGILVYLLGIVSILTMVMIAVQRYYKIVKPNEHRNIFSPRFVVLSIVFIWSTGIVLVVIFALTSRGVQFYEEFPVCLVLLSEIAVFVGFYPFCLFLPFFVMSLLYFKIWRFVKHHNAEMNHSNVNTEEVKLTKSLCIVLAAFVACYIPFTTLIACAYFEVELPRQILVLAQIMAGFSTTVNPIIYGVMNREFRKEFVKIICYPWKSRVAVEAEPAQ